MVLFDDFNRIQTVTDPVGRASTFFYSAVAGVPAPTQFLDQVDGPAGAQTSVTYTQVTHPNTPVLIIAKQVDVTDADGTALAATRTFSMDPFGLTGHNYSGYPTYKSDDEMFDANDSNYRYTTAISSGPSSTQITYDSLHRVVERDVIASSDPIDNSDDVPVQQQVMTYPGFAPPQALDPNYSRPLTTSITSTSSSGPDGFVASDGSRTTTTQHTYDPNGRLLTFTDELGNTTVNTYDATYGLLTSTVVTGEDGSRRSLTNVLSDDKKVVKSASVAEAKAGGDLSARTIVSYEYDSYGQLSKRTVAWAAGAAPPDNGGGPASSTTTYVSTVDAAAVTQTVQLTLAAGTAAAMTSTTVVDLVSGMPVKTTDALNRVTTKTYDAANQILSVSPPDGLGATTVYQNADDNGPATKTVTEADGHVTQTTYDALGPDDHRHRQRDQGSVRHRSHGARCVQSRLQHRRQHPDLDGSGGSAAGHRTRRAGPGRP